LEDVGKIDLDGIHWVIVGGESGPGARPLKKEWVETIREQCETADVPFFFKQWGGFQKSRNGRELNGRTYDGMPDRSTSAVASRRVRLGLLDEVEKWQAVSQ